MGNCHHELQVRNVIPKMVHRLRKVLKNLYVIYKFISIFSDIFFYFEIIESCLTQGPITMT